MAPTAFSSVAPHHFSYAFSAALVYSHPAVAYSAAIPAITTYSEIPTTTYAAVPAAARDASLMWVVHNPSHSVSYRAD